MSGKDCQVQPSTHYHSPCSSVTHHTFLKILMSFLSYMEKKNKLKEVVFISIRPLGYQVCSEAHLVRRAATLVKKLPPSQGLHPSVTSATINPGALSRGTGWAPQDGAHPCTMHLMKAIGKNAVFKRLEMYSYCYHSLLCVYA